MLAARSMTDAQDSGLPARRIAARALAETLSQRRVLDQTLAGQPDFKRMEARDRAFARAIAAVTLRRLGQTRAALAQFLDRPLPDNAVHARAILESAAAQMIFLDVPAHAAVDSAVALMTERRETARYKSLANAVLRKIGKAGSDLKEIVPVRENLPDWLRTRWTEAYGAETVDRIAKAWMGEPPLDLTLKDAAQAETMAGALGAEILPTGSLRLPRAAREMETLPGFAEGRWWVQDAAAAIPARLFGDLQGKRALDLCAAPGGKTMQLAAGGAQVTALDRSAKRLKRVEENLARTGLPAEIIAADAAQWTPPDGALFEAVLLDAPCSATGTLRRSPDAAWTKRPEDVAALTRTQAAILRRAAELTAPGGRLVYCVCSLQPEEGEAVIEAFLMACSDFEIAPADAEALGLPEEAVRADGTVRTLPSFWPESGGMDGFYAVALNKARSGGV